MSRVGDEGGLLKGFDSPDEVRGRRRRLVVAGVLAGACLAFLGVWAYELAGAPGFCGGCHSMGPISAGWRGSGHKQFGCVECHMPVGNIITRVGYKAVAGARDLYQETVRSYGAQAGLSAGARGIVNENCLRCHSTTVENTSLARGRADCMRCHVGLVHRRGPGQGGLRVEGKN
jgi:cytochrome c nitrite reductase small subunit